MADANIALSRASIPLNQSRLDIPAEMAAFLPFRTTESIVHPASRKRLGGVVSAKFDIFLRQCDGQPIWIKAVETLDEAKRQLRELSKESPGEYFIFNAIHGRVVVN